MTRLAAACLLMAALTGCTGEAPEAASPTAPERRTESVQPQLPTSPSTSVGDEIAVEPTGAPEPGDCHRITLQEAARPTDDRPPVPCSRRHTSQTFHVGRLDTIVSGHSVGVDSRRVQQQLAETCPARLADFLGGDAETRALSRFQTVWFSPTLEQYDAGADWFRCDVVALATSRRLLELPTAERLRGVLDRPEGLAEYGLCGTARPGAEGFERVACALRHSWVAISTIPIAGGDRYPGAAAVRDAGDSACSDEVADRNESLNEYSYGWEWPTAAQWRAGQRHGFCWAPIDLV